MFKLSGCRASLYALVLMALVSSCGSVGTASGGLNDESYILVSAVRHYAGRDVLVSVDNAPNVQVMARKQRKTDRRAQRITIVPGRHRVAVRDLNGRLLYDKEIFVSSRSSKIITLE